LRIIAEVHCSMFDIPDLSEGRYVVEFLHKDTAVGMLYYCSALQSNKLAGKKGEERRMVWRTSQLSSLVTILDLFIGMDIEEKRYQDGHRA
jgi:hypothetical protein